MELLNSNLKLELKDISKDADLAVLSNESDDFNKLFEFNRNYMYKMREILGKKFMRKDDSIVLMKIGSDLSLVKEAHLSNESLENLKDIPILPNLVYIDLNVNDINDMMELHPLINSHKLKGIDLINNGIESLANFPEFENLERLNLFGNELSNLIGFPILPNLKHLVLGHNKITEMSVLDVLKDFPKLESLRIDATNITTLEGFPMLRHLETLNLTGDKIEHMIELRHLIGLPKLKNIGLSGNNIETIDNFPMLTQLISLNLNNNKIKTMKGFPMLPKLEVLNISENEIESAEKYRVLLESLPALNRFIVYGNPTDKETIPKDLSNNKKMKFYREELELEALEAQEEAQEEN